MFKLVAFLRKKPSDVTIRSIRTIFSLSIAALLIFANGKFLLPMQSYYADYVVWAVYAIAGIFIIHAGVF